MASKDLFELTVHENDTLDLTVENVDGETLEFFGEAGNLLIASDFESMLGSDEDIEPMTLPEALAGTREFLTEWFVAEDVADAITDKLEPWLARHTVSDNEAARAEIKKYQEWIRCRRGTLARKNDEIKHYRQQMAKWEKFISSAAAGILEIEESIQELEDRIQELEDRIAVSEGKEA